MRAAKSRSPDEGGRSAAGQTAGPERAATFADNRPETNALGRLARALNTSARVEAQGRLLREVRYEAPQRQRVGPIQRRPIDPGTLNVAGEKHDESAALYDKEREFSIEEGGGHHWREYEFEYDGKYGDPPQLRLIYHLKQMNGLATQLLQLISAISDEVFSARVLQCVGGLQKILALVPLDEVELELQQRGMEPWSEVGEVYIPLHKALIDLVKPLKAEGGGQLRAQLRDALDSVVRFTKHVTSKIEGDVASARKKRSEVMLEVANAAVEGNVTGVWKVGQRHINDMDQVDADFNIMTRDEYQAGFQRYWAKVFEAFAEEAQQVPE